MTPSPGLMIGVVLTGVGVMGAFGSITGNLPAMIAALFYPSLLQPGANSGAPTVTSTKGITKAQANDAVGLATLNPAPSSAYASQSALSAWVKKEYPKLTGKQRTNVTNAYAAAAPFRT